MLTLMYNNVCSIKKIITDTALILEFTSLDGKINYLLLYCANSIFAGSILEELPGEVHIGNFGTTIKEVNVQAAVTLPNVHNVRGGRITLTSTDTEGYKYSIGDTLTIYVFIGSPT